MASKKNRHHLNPAPALSQPTALRKNGAGKCTRHINFWFLVCLGTSYQLRYLGWRGQQWRAAVGLEFWNLAGPVYKKATSRCISSTSKGFSFENKMLHSLCAIYDNCTYLFPYMYRCMFDGILLHSVSNLFLEMNKTEQILMHLFKLMARRRIQRAWWTQLKGYWPSISVAADKLD